MKCTKHPKYGAIRRPRVNCEMCWRQYIEKHPTIKIWESPLIKNDDYWLPAKLPVKLPKSKYRLGVSKDAPWH